MKRSTDLYLNEWDELLTIPLNSFTDLVQPTKSSPHRQLMHLFTSVFKVKISESHRNDIKSTFKYVSKLTSEKLGVEPVYLSKFLNEFSLNEFHTFLKCCMLNKKIHNRYANILQSTYKNVLNKAIYLNIPNFERFYLPSSFCYYTRVTERYKPYNNDDREKITEAIESDINKISNCLNPYQKLGKGREVIDEKNKVIVEDGNTLTLEDARWIFENKMECTPITSLNEFRQTDIGNIFYKIINDNNAFYQDVYESWGVLCKIKMNHLLPLLLRLMQITGMNVESIYTLELNDLVDKHPATGKPCLRYWKDRSSGQKLYHLDIFKANLQWLTHSQGTHVKDIFNIVTKLTSTIRKKASPEQKNKLWLFETHNGLIRNLPNTGHLTIALKAFSEKHQLLDQTSGKKILETTRFRPTFVSDLIEKGVSIREIQLLMGHKNLYTTMRYLDIHDFGQIARQKIKDKLLEIHSNINFSKDNTPHKKVDGINNHRALPISTPLATCKNIFDPPESVKALKNYILGKPCSTYNMCLSCPNIIITKTDLPKLFAMKRDYLVKIQNSRILDTPFGYVIKSNLALLNSILDPEVSEFNFDELDDAEKLSLYVETTEFI